MARHPIHVKRVYEPIEDGDGCRILVDGIWPRGQRREDVGADLWLKSVAPSAGLRRWFGHDPDRWDEFRRRYAEELRDQAEALDTIRDRRRQGPVTLLFSARDERHNQAVALRRILDDGDEAES